MMAANSPCAGERRERVCLDRITVTAGFNHNDDEAPSRTDLFSVAALDISCLAYS